MNFSSKSQYCRGFNLIEAAIVLGVVGLVLGGIWVASASVKYRLAVSETAKGTLGALYAVRDLYQKQACPGTTTEIDPLSIDLGVASTWPRAGSTGVKTPLGASMNITIDCTAYGVGAIIITYWSFTYDMCTNLTPLLAGRDFGSSSCSDGMVTKGYYWSY